MKKKQEKHKENQDQENPLKIEGSFDDVLKVSVPKKKEKETK
jgi:hypothetical protein